MKAKVLEALTEGAAWILVVFVFILFCFRSTPGNSTVHQSLATTDVEDNKDQSLNEKIHVTDQ